MGGNERVVDRQTRYEDAEAESEAEGNEVDLFRGWEKHIKINKKSRRTSSGLRARGPGLMQWAWAQGNGAYS